MTHDLSGAYALDAVSAAERAAYEREIAASEELRSEATELHDTAVILGLAVAPVTPSVALRERLIAQIATTNQLPSLVDAAPGPAETRARSRWSRPVLAVTSVAAAVAVIVAGVSLAGTMLRPDPQTAQMTAISASPDMKQRTADLAGGETVTLRWSHELASAVLIVDGMRPAPSEKVYQLWYIGEQGARPAGFITVNDGAKSWRVLDGAMAAGDDVGVTVEPMGGSEQPTSDPIMMIET